MKIIKKNISFSSLLILLLTFYCTDVCPSVQVDWIVQFTAPISTADYIHRVGRTARIGQFSRSSVMVPCWCAMKDCHKYKFCSNTLEQNRRVDLQNWFFPDFSPTLVFTVVPKTCLWRNNFFRGCKTCFVVEPGASGSSVIFLLPSEAGFIKQLEKDQIPLVEMTLEQVLQKLLRWVKNNVKKFHSTQS